MLKKLLIALLLILYANSSYAAVSFTERYVDNTLASETKPEGTATGGGATWICLEAGSDATDDQYNDYGISTTGGTGPNQHLRITDFVGTGGGNCELEATVDSAWGVNPDSSTTYEITIGSDANNGVAEGVYGGTNGAWRTVVYGATQCNDQRLNIKAGREYDLQEGIIGGVSNSCRMWGYTSTVGDGGRAIIDAQGTVAIAWTHGADSWKIIDLEFKGATGDCIYMANPGFDGTVLWNVLVHNCGDDGIHITSNGITAQIFNTEIHTATGQGANIETGTNVMYSYIHDTTAGGASEAGYFLFNIVDTTGGDNLLDGVYVMNNTFYNSTGENFDSAGFAPMLLINNLFHTASTYNVDVSYAPADNAQFIGYNSYYAWTTASKHADVYGLILDLENNQTGDPDLVDPANATAANNDFNLGSSTTIDDTGFPPTYPGIVNTIGHIEPGAIPYEETGGVGAVTTSYGYSN